MNTVDNSHANLTLLDAFRAHYFRLNGVIEEAMRTPTDATVLERIGDDLMEYSSLLDEVGRSLCLSENKPQCVCLLQHEGIFDPAEFQRLQNNLPLMISDIRIRHNQSLDESHRGHPIVVAVRQNGRRGRPQIVFDAEFLAWAYNRRSISALARFLGVGRTTLRNALVEHGILIQQQPNHSRPSSPSPSPQPSSYQPPHMQEFESDPGLESDDILEPNLDPPEILPEDVQNIFSPTSVSTSNRHSQISDEDLDDLIIRLRLHYRRAGIGMLDGMLTRLGHRVQRERIRMSLLRIDPVRRVFERIRIRRRTYRVAGPNALWHHDGQHGELSYFRQVIMVLLSRILKD
jgi:hypothetical protein